MKKEKIKNIAIQFNESIKVKSTSLNDKNLIQDISDSIDKIIYALGKKKKLLVAGNGGSAADSQHFVAELVGRYNFDRPPLNALALTTDTSVLTCIGNDYSYEDIFSRQIEGLGSDGDVFFAISTSGNSPNIIKALKKASSMGILTIGLTGRDGGLMKNLCDICICVKSNSTPRIQETHLLIEHIICSMVEDVIFGNDQIILKSIPKEVKNEVKVYNSIHINF